MLSYSNINYSINDITSDKYKNNIFKHYCLQEIQKINIKRDIKYNNKKFKIKYSNDYYLTMILKLLNVYNAWEQLTNDKMYIVNSKYHYKTIYNKFIYWSSNNIFRNALNNFNINYSNSNHTNTFIIDATIINNLYGSENVALNRSNFKHHATNLSLISDTNRIIYSSLLCPVNKKISHTGNEYFTMPNDLKMIDDHLKDLEYVNNNNSKYYILLADKGYKTSDKFLLHNKPVNIITPDKSNSKNKINIAKKIKLIKNRRKIEHVNAILKKNTRLNIRRDRNKITFINFVYMGSILNNIKQYINILKDKFTNDTIDIKLKG